MRIILSTKFLKGQEPYSLLLTMVLPLVWMSKKQNMVSLLTTEAGKRAMAELLPSAVYIQTLSKSFKKRTKIMMEIMTLRLYERPKDLHYIYRQARHIHRAYDTEKCPAPT